MDANVDLRYWSVCKYRSVADGAVDSCIYDEQAPVDGAGRTLIVVSTPAHAAVQRSRRVRRGMDRLGRGRRHRQPARWFCGAAPHAARANFKNSLWATQKPGR